MDTDRKRRHFELANNALWLPPAERAAYIKANCPNEEDQAAVESLLRHDQIAGPLPHDLDEGLPETPDMTNPSDQHSLNVGDRLGEDIVVKRFIAQGGMGEVYEAVRGEGEHLAIKVIRKTYASDPEMIARFRSEVRRARVGHRNICPVYDLHPGVPVTGVLGTPSGTVTFIAMELLTGVTLAERIRDAAMGPNEALPIAIQISQALEAAHDKRVIHCDLKPNNVMLVQDEKSGLRAYVTDFGIARVFNQSPPLQAIGAPAYMAPEQRTPGRPITAAVDIWAFGVLLYETLTGMSAPEGGVSEPRKLLSGIRAIDPRWLHLIFRCLTAEPEGRPNAKELIQILQNMPHHRLPLDVPPSAERQVHFRAIALRRFAFSWLLLDQLPAGGWGRSLAPWMNANWAGSTLVPDMLIEEEGGMESSVLAFHCYYYSYLALFPGMITPVVRGFLAYLQRQRDPVSGGFGTQTLTQAGMSLAVTLRHTALGAYALLLLNRCQPAAHESQLTGSLLYLFGRRSDEYVDNRNGCLLYALMFYLSEKIRDYEPYAPPAELLDRIRRWRDVDEPRMREVFKTAEYIPIPSSANHSLTVWPYLKPYGGFVRMTSYTLLAVCTFVSDQMPDDVKSWIRAGVEHLITEYATRFSTERSVNNDPLKPAVRGTDAWPRAHCPECRPLCAGHPDLGCTAMLLEVLQNPSARAAIWQSSELPPRFSMIPQMLLEDLQELFDRYLIEPAIFRFTNAGSLAHLLLVPGFSYMQPPSDLFQLHPRIEHMRFVEGLSEASLNRFVETEIFRSEDDLPTHVFARSVSRLLLDRTRPGRYPEGRFAPTRIAESTDKLITDTLEVYTKESFVAKFAGVWASAPMIDVGSTFARLCRSRNGKTLLDVACGPGQNAKFFSDMGFDVTLLDGSDAMLHTACANLGRSRADKCLQLNLLHLSDMMPPIAPVPIRYDAIWLSGALIHFPIRAVQQIVKNLVGLMSDRGVLMVNIAIDNPRLIATDGRFFAYWRTQDDFARILTAQGLQIETVLTNYIRANTYQEARLEIRWDNFICVKTVEQPIGNPSELTSLAYDLIVRRFLRQHHQTRPDSALENMLTLLRGKRGRVLDAGCGPGYDTDWFQKRGFKAIGIDLSPQMIDMAASDHRECEFRVGDFTELSSFPADHFVGIFCMAAFQHVPISRAQQAINGFYRVLEPGGVLLLNVQLNRATGWEPDGRFTQGYQEPGEVLLLLRTAGFDVEDPVERLLPAGHNTFQREMEFRFCDLIARKPRGRRSGVRSKGRC